MSHIYWELHEIPRPSGSYINHSDGRVFLMTEDGLGKKKRKVIGRATSETMMHPNDLFRYLYPALWSEYYGDRNLPEHEQPIRSVSGVIWPEAFAPPRDVCLILPKRKNTFPTDRRAVS